MWCILKEKNQFHINSILKIIRFLEFEILNEWIRFDPFRFWIDMESIYLRLLNAFLIRKKLLIKYEYIHKDWYKFFATGQTSKFDVRFEPADKMFYFPCGTEEIFLYDFLVILKHPLTIQCEPFCYRFDSIYLWLCVTNPGASREWTCLNDSWYRRSSRIWTEVPQ